MAITANDRIAALEIACRAERDAVERAERAGNGVAAAINRQRMAVAESRLAAATLRASFTIFEDADGYWFVPLESEADPTTVSKPGEPVYTTKIAACRAALAIAVVAGATELHLFGMGSTTTIKKDAKQKGVKPFVYWPSIRSRIAPFVPRGSKRHTTTK